MRAHGGQSPLWHFSSHLWWPGHDKRRSQISSQGGHCEESDNGDDDDDEDDDEDDRDDDDDDDDDEEEEGPENDESNKVATAELEDAANFEVGQHLRLHAWRPHARIFAHFDSQTGAGAEHSTALADM